MIAVKSTTYWSTGITVTWHARAGSANGESHSGWSASLHFLDDGFCDDDADAGQVSTEGRLHTRYAVQDGDAASGLDAAVNALVADAARLRITFRDPGLYYRGDGEDSDWPPPENWRTTLGNVAERIGWTTPYKLGGEL